MKITPELFIDLTLQMLPKVIAKLEETIAEYQQEIESLDPEEAMQIILDAIIDLRQEIGKELLPEGITDREMENYKREHEAEIEKYLASHPELRDQLNKLEQEFQTRFPA